MRNSLEFASWKERKLLAAALKPIYTAPSAEAAAAELDAFEAGPWGRKFPTVVAAWRRAWDRVIPFFAFAPPIRRVIYTTNAIESINARLRKIIKTRGHFPSDDAAAKLIWLALRNITADWRRAAKEWREAMNQFAIAYGDRFIRNAALLHESDLPTVSVFRLKQRSPPWTSLRIALHTKIRTGPALGVAHPNRRHRLRALQRLDLALLVHAQHQRRPGGFKYSSVMSRTFSTKAGSSDNLKLRDRCGAMLAVRNRRCAMSLLMLASAAKLRTLQCVCLLGRVCSA